jgi:hypothetical protein
MNTTKLSYILNLKMLFIYIYIYILPEMWGILWEEGGGWREMSVAKH